MLSVLRVRSGGGSLCGAAHIQQGTAMCWAALGPSWHGRKEVRVAGAGGDVWGSSSVLEP